MPCGHSHGLSRRTQLIKKCCHCNSEMFSSVCTLSLISLHQSIIQTDSFSSSPALVSNSSQQKRKKKKRSDENKHFFSGSTWSKKDINDYHFLFFTWELLLHLYILTELNVAAGNVRCEPWLWCSTHWLYSSKPKESPSSCSLLLSCYGTLSPLVNHERDHGRRTKQSLERISSCFLVFQRIHNFSSK